MYCVLGLCLCVSRLAVPVNETIYPSVCLRLLSVYLSLFHKTASCRDKGRKGASVVLREGKERRCRQKEEEQERKRVVPKPTRGSDIDERERTSAKLTLQRAEEKLDTEGRYTQRARERK